MKLHVPSSWSLAHWWVRWVVYLVEGCVMCHGRFRHPVWCRWRP